MNNSAAYTAFMEALKGATAFQSSARQQRQHLQQQAIPQRVGGGTFVGIDKRTGSPIFDIGIVPCHSFSPA